MDQPDNQHTRPSNSDDDSVAAAGKVSEALEWVERARGHLYELHQLMGHADFLFGDAADMLEKAGCHKQAELVRQQIVGRNVLTGKWTFQVVEDFNKTYYEPVKEAEAHVREQLMDGRKHVYEAELKAKRRAHLQNPDDI